MKKNELVPSNFFNKSKDNFIHELQISARKIKDSFEEIEEKNLNKEDKDIIKIHTLDEVFNGLYQYYQNQLENDREEINEAILKLSSDKFKGRIENIIEEKNREIEELQSKLNKLLPKSSTEKQGFNDREIENAEERVRMAQTKSKKDIRIPELVTEPQIKDMFECFKDNLDDIKKDVQESHKLLETALEDASRKTQKYYNRSINTLIVNLKKSYDETLEIVEEKYQERLDNLEEAYEHQKKVLNDKIKECEEQNSKLENEKELGIKVRRILDANPSIKLKRIVWKSENNNTISNINETIKEIGDIYNQLEFFSSVYSNKEELNDLLFFMNTANDIMNPYLLYKNSESHVEYAAHIQDIGDISPVTDGEKCGRQSKRLESIRINLLNASGGISYSVYASGIGWIKSSNNDWAGTKGQSRRLEAIRIRLTGDISLTHNISYKLYIQSVGWIDWVNNNEEAGIPGSDLSLEAIMIKLIPKSKEEIYSHLNINKKIEEYNKSCFPSISLNNLITQYNNFINLI